MSNEGDLAGVASLATRVGFRNGYADGYEQAMHDMCTLGMLGYYRPRECWNWLREFLTKDLNAWANSVCEPHTPPKFAFPPSWSRQRKATFARDGHKCVSCGSSVQLECDHVLPVAVGGFGALENLSTRCSNCHSEKTRPSVTAL
jgi:hypothetical protein